MNFVVIVIILSGAEVEENDLDPLVNRNLDRVLAVQSIHIVFWVVGRCNRCDVRSKSVVLANLELMCIAKLNNCLYTR